LSSLKRRRAIRPLGYPRAFGAAGARSRLRTAGRDPIPIHAVAVKYNSIRDPADRKA